MKKRDITKSQRQARANVKARKAKALAISQAEAAKNLRRKARLLVGSIVGATAAVGVLSMMISKEIDR